MKTTVRSEVHQIVTRAQLAGKPITSLLIWGSIERQMPYQNALTLLSLMVRAEQLVNTPGEAVGASGKPPGTYTTGPMPVRSERGAQEYFPRMLGNMEHKRLKDARAAARAFWKKGESLCMIRRP